MERTERTERKKILQDSPSALTLSFKNKSLTKRNSWHVQREAKDPLLRIPPNIKWNEG